MTEVYLRGLSRWQAEQQRDAVADVHVTAYDGVAGAEYRDRQGFLRRFEQHVQQPGFDMTVADGEVLSAAPTGSGSPVPASGGRASAATCRRRSRNSPSPGGRSGWPA